MMRRWITADDIIETYAKLQQRGLAFLLSKLSISSRNRTLSAFNDTEIKGANWWHVPLVRKRWNQLTTGNADVNFEDFVAAKFLNYKSGLCMASIGCGNGTHELNFAKYGCFESIIGYDISDKLINEANQKAAQLHLRNVHFVATDIAEAGIAPYSLDVVLFYSSLHHFDNIESFLPLVKNWLKPNGLLIIHEYVGPNRLILSAQQAKVATQWLQYIPVNFRKRFKTGLIKNSVSGPGVWRMLLSDPSEAVDSERILPCIHKHFETLHEAKFGTLMMMLVLKDIAHHFIQSNIDVQEVLEKLFDEEDKWMQTNQADFVFGVYRAG